MRRRGRRRHAPRPPSGRPSGPPERGDGADGEAPGRARSPSRPFPPDLEVDPQPARGVVLSALYQAYQAVDDLLTPVRVASGAAMVGLQAIPEPLQNPWTRHLAGVHELVVRSRVTHERPRWGIDTVPAGLDGALTEIVEEVVDRTPFGTLLRFAKPSLAAVEQPKVLLVAPLSGHFATLLRQTVRTMSSDLDVHVTDWRNARDIPVRYGRFGLDEHIEHIVRFLRVLGPGAHVVAVCQPCVPALAAVALMAEDDDPATPCTLTLMAGPVDGRVNPTAVNDLAVRRPLEWFERNVIAPVPRRFAGAGRLVYPGFLQLGAFMGMNVGRHLKSHLDLYRHVLAGEQEDADIVRLFYDEYNAVLDLPAEFYLETVQRVFQDFDLARGTFRWRDRLVDPGSIRSTALLTVEGERDDICGVGQTAAALDLCTAIPPTRRHRLVQAGAGHYGVFSGSRWVREIHPAVRDFIGAHAA